MTRLVLSLCDYSGAWSQPYVDAGYRVIRVDLAAPPDEDPRAERVLADVRTWTPPAAPWAVLAAPPCTCFSRVGSRWWARQDAAGETAEMLSILRACFRICRTAAGWWALENPPGRLPDLAPDAGRPAWAFQPWEYGDPWTKQTYIWGTAWKPPIRPVTPAASRCTWDGRKQGSRTAWLSGTARRERAETPAGFARAFFEANP